MQNFPSGSSLPKASGRRSARPVSSDDAEPTTSDDSVDSIARRLAVVDTAVVTVPAASATHADLASPATVPPEGSTIAEVPPLTRRELREREARAASQARERESRAASRRLLFPQAGSTSAPSTVPADVVKPAPARAAGASEREVAEAAAVDGVRPRRTKVTRRAARRAAGASAAPRGRSAKAARAAQPRVAAVVTATAPPPGRVASAKRRILSQLVTVGAMAGVGLILVATTVPANAFSRPDAEVASVEAAVTASESSSSEQTQALTVEAVPASTVTRDGYTVISQKQQVAAKYGNQLLLYTNNPNGTIQWPFPTGVPITSGFGGRKVAGCGFCSTNHLGVDFTPGAGTPIQAIADGTVSLVEVSGSGLGNHVIVDHVVNGQKVQSVYAHMQYGSIKVAEGQQVTVGEILGAVGSTGASTGAHLHLEVHLDGTPVDPFAWLKANAN